MQEDGQEEGKQLDVVHDDFDPKSVRPRLPLVRPT